MEDALWGGIVYIIRTHVLVVLILVLMEDALWEEPGGVLRARKQVLILVLVEDALWVKLVTGYVKVAYTES